MTLRPDTQKNTSHDDAVRRDRTTTDGSLELGRAVGSIARRLAPESGVLSSGERAELRRISTSQPFTPVLWRVLLDLDRSDAPRWISQSEWERRWATLLMCMAHCPGLHDYGIPFGRGLAEAGWSELRFTRLLRAEGDGLETRLRRVAQYLSSNMQPVDWTDVARLLFYQSGQTSEEIRLGIAREYYRALHIQQE